jgi:hypothetical protein
MSALPPAEEDRTVMPGRGADAPVVSTPQPLIDAQEQPKAETGGHGGPASHNALPVGTRLAEFEIEGLIGEGGFGIVYLTHDHSLDRRVALKEYMPSELAQRASGVHVSVRSQRHAETFAAGMRSFINEARLLAQFDHPSLVKVYRFWEANGTAYMVMPFYEGATLKEALRRLGHSPDEAWLKHLLAQLLDALEIIHARQCYHRDIAPDNILLLQDDRPVLLDFGAARRVIGDMTQALTVILKPGYAPIEQYAEVPDLKQGPWTDLYALASVVYFAITGQAPVPAVARVMSDPLVPLVESARGRYSQDFLAAIDSALAVKPEHRPQSVEEFRSRLGLGHAGGATRYLAADTVMVPPTANLPTSGRAPKAATAAHGRGRKVALIGGGAALALALAGLLAFVVFDAPPQDVEAQRSATPTPESPAIPAATLAEVNAKLASFECARLNASVDGSTLAVRGNVVSRNDMKRLGAELGEIGGVRGVNTSGVQVVPRPHCETVAVLAPYIEAGARAPAIALKGGAGSAHAGEKLIVEVTGAEFPAAVYAALFDTEGNVVHLLPNTKEKRNRFEPHQRMSLGDDPVFGMQWEIVPPFGTHMLVVVASRSPLLPESRKEVEPASAYHRALMQGLEGKSAGDVRAAYTMVDFLPGNK